jgi:hypothetical protein
MGLFNAVLTFQETVVATWHGSLEVVHILLMPVIPLDEMTKEGSSTILLDFMVKAGLICWNGEMCCYELKQGWESKWLYVVGDGLTLDRIHQFIGNI